MKFRWGIIAFIVFFFTSRLFSEIFLLLPKWTDLLDIPFILLLAIFAFPRKRHLETSADHHRFLLRSLLFFTVAVLFSALANFQDLYPPSALLFWLGFVEGPLLFLALNKLAAPDRMVLNVRQILYFLFFANVIVVVFINLPMFFATGNPDSVAGTFGLNSYQFSILLVVCGGLLLGEARSGRLSPPLLALGQSFICVTYYLLQYRASIPFFLLAYAVMIALLYSHQVLRMAAAILIIGLCVKSGIEFVNQETQGPLRMKYGDWITILENPEVMLRYGKMGAYADAVTLMADSPLIVLAGVGPGNALSRAYYTFGKELESAFKSGKGVGKLLQDHMGVTGPRYTPVGSEFDKLATVVAFGSYQLSNPSSSFLAPILEIGWFGAGVLITLYLYVLRHSIMLLRYAKERARDLLPIATASVGGVVYLFGLAFLDNYWETSRATLLIWLVFWAVCAGVHARRLFTGNTLSTESTQ